MKRVGLIVQDLDTDYIQELTEGVQHYCSIYDMQLFIFIVRAKNWWNGVFDYQHFACMSLATKQNLDGILLVTNTYCQHYPEGQRAGLVYELKSVPLVSIGVNIPGISSVIPDGKKAFRQLMEHIYSKHHKRKFAFMMPPNVTNQDIIERFEVYKEFLADKKIPFEESKVFYANYIFEDAVRALQMNGITKKNIDFDVLITCGDDVAFGSIAYLSSVGLRVPQDVIVTGYDNQPRCENSNPTLSSIDQCIFDQGFDAAELLAEQMNNPKTQSRCLVIESKPVFRRSCGCKYHKRDKITAADEGKQYRQRSHLTHFQFFLQEMQSSVSLKEFKDLLIKNLREFDIEKCVICLYDEPVYLSRSDIFTVPKAAKVLIAYNREDTYSVLDAVETDPTAHMVPYTFRFAQTDTVVVTSLFNTSMQYGYALYTPGDVDPSVYEMIFSAAGIALASNRMLTLKKTEESSEKEHKRLLERNPEIISSTDILTGIMNKTGFINYGSDMLRIALGTGKNGCVIFADIDDLKKINEEYGHDAGDRAIVTFCNLLRSVFRNTDLMGRLGSDEIAIIAPSMNEAVFKRNKAKVEALIGDYNRNSKEKFILDASIGCVFFPECSSDLNVLLKEAEASQQKEKESKQNQQI